MRSTQLLFVVLAAVIAPFSWGQRLAGLEYKAPATAVPQRLAQPSPPGMRLAPPPLAALEPLSDAEVAGIEPRVGVEPIGVHRDLTRAMTGLASAAWTQASDGSALWRLELRSPGAAALRVRLEGFSVGAGRVWIYDGEGQVLGPYSGSGPNGSNGMFWSDLLFGESAIVEYSPADGVARREPPFRVSSVAHLWQTPVPQDGSVAVDQAAPCQVDVTCSPELEPTTRAVARILFEEGDASYNCTGTLLNNRNEDFTPYFLTAAHCIRDQDVASTLIAFWNYKTSTCNGAEPRLADTARTAGSTLVATLGNFDDNGGDMTLLLLSDIPSSAYFAGWDADPVAIGADTITVHHPQASYMRVTTGTVVTDRIYNTSPDIYALVRETKGRTEPGSSGSALLSAPGVVRGALSFGPQIPRFRTACDVNPYYGGYTHFSAFYPMVQQYLEGDAPPPTETPAPDPTPEPEPSGLVLSPGGAIDFTLPAVNNPTLFRTDSYRIDVPDNATSLTVRAEALTPNADIDLYLRYGQAASVVIGVIIADASSASASGTEEITWTTADGLRGGAWYASLASYSTGLAIQGRIQATIEVGAGTGNPQISAVVHGATFSPGAIAPGEIVTLFGQGLGPPDGVQAALNTQGRLPSAVTDTVVLFDELPAPIFFVQSNQINAQVPYEVAGRGSVRVAVTRNGVLTNLVTVPVDDAAPGLFQLGAGRAVALNADGTLNGPDNPARRGDVVLLYGTGEGTTDGANVDGQPAATAPLARPVLPASVRIGGADADLLFAGSAPGFVGLLQVNARISLSSASGSAVPVTLRVGQTDSLSATIAVE
ncbi:MAG: hypothetical protein GC160_21805 [Acidobacteria bacterium]|nr:hypothetical protein [Acidobacteriota bacterium]